MSIPSLENYQRFSIQSFNYFARFNKRIFQERIRSFTRDYANFKTSFQLAIRLVIVIVDPENSYLELYFFVNITDLQVEQFLAFVPLLMLAEYI